jgi:hypothetical protein
MSVPCGRAAGLCAKPRRGRGLRPAALTVDEAQRARVRDLAAGLLDDEPV